MDSPREFFETLASRVDPAKAAGLTATYRFEIDGWHYVFNANAIGNTREEAEARASLLDVSLCTFRKR